jgi:hypothetical protein
MEGQVRSFCQWMAVGSAAALAVTYCVWAHAADVPVICPDSGYQDIGYVVSANPAALLPTLPPDSSDWRQPAQQIVLANYAPQYQSSGGQYLSAEAAQPSGPNCSTCNQGACCSDELRHGLIVFVDYDAFRGISDGGWENNGVNAGVNFGTRLGSFSDLTGIGFQIGGSTAVYDWVGTDYRWFRQDEAEVQGFVTYGLFRHATDDSPWSATVVQDWMINANYGVFASNPTLSQLRVQAGYAMSDATEVGIWGAWRLMDDSRDVPGIGTVRWRSIDQLSAYWHYQWNSYGPETWVWVGVPEFDRLGASGSLGDWLAAALTTAPLTDRLGLYALVTYMHPSTSAGGVGATEDAWNFTIGLAFYPAANARNRSVYGQRWMPQLPVANNGYFFVDSH